MEKPKYRDSLFRHYFLDDKRRLLSLLNALTNSDCDDPDEIELNTLDGLFFSAVKNDISCVFRNQLIVLIEHQSTLNENMPLRMLFYFVELLKRGVDNSRQFYDEDAIEFLEPKFFVIYNGLRKAPERREMRLSDSFNKSTDIELKVQFLNVNAGNNRELIGRSESLKNYCTFVDRVEYNRRQKMSLLDAIRDAVNYCIKGNVMAEYLRTNIKEVMEMYWFEYDAAAEREAIREGALKAGIKKGLKEGTITMIKEFFKAGTPIEFIKKATGQTEEQILAIVNEKV